MEPGPSGPIYLVNLLKFKERAEYADGREEFGGAGMFVAPVERLVLGEVEELWDKIAIAMYPSRGAMRDMMSSEKMRGIGVHRAAGLAGQLNIETAHATGEWLGA